MVLFGIPCIVILLLGRFYGLSMAHLRGSICLLYSSHMSLDGSGIPTWIVTYLANTPPDVLAVRFLVVFGWFPVWAVLVWGFAQLWKEFKNGRFAAGLKHIVLEIKVPQNTAQTPKGMELFFTNLAGTKTGMTWREQWLVGKFPHTYSFEIWSRGGDISFLIYTQERFRDIIEADFYAQYPEAHITVIDDPAVKLPTEFPNESMDVFGGEFILKKEPYYPIRTYDEFEHQGEKDNRFKDPLLPVLELLGKVQPGETLAIQIMIMQTPSDDWIKQGLEFLGKIMGKEPPKPKPSTAQQLSGAIAGFPAELLRQATGVDFAGGKPADKKPDDFRAFKLTAAERLQIDAVAEKIAKVGWWAKVRYVGVGPKTKFRKGFFAAGIKNLLQPFASQLLNSFAANPKSIPQDDYFWQKWSYTKRQERLLVRFKGRDIWAGAVPTVLNAEELATMWHFPAADARTPVLAQMGARRAEAPTTLPYAQAHEDGPLDWKKVYGGNVKEEDEIVPLVGIPHPSSSPGKNFTLPVLPPPTTPSAPLGLPDNEAPQLRPLDDSNAPPDNLPM